MSWAGILELAAPAVAALGGSWVGARLALRRFKRERAFEYRLEWYRQTLRAVNHVHRSFQMAALATRRGLHEEAGNKLRDANDGVMEALELTHEAKLFAAKSTVAALQEAERRVGEIHVPEQTSTTENIIQKSERLAEIFHEVSNTIAADGRKHLGSNPIEE